MNFNELDLNIENYTLNDILNLFQINEDFDLNDLKRIKKLIIQTHPDKSKLSPKYFNFFKSAYKILIDINNFRRKNGISSFGESIDIDNKLNSYFKNKTKKEFNKEFNEIFENVYLKDENENKGYDEWLKSDNDFIEKENDIEKHKKDIIVRKDINDIECYNLNNSSNYFDYSNKSSKFSGNDIRKVYFEETIIPVDEDSEMNMRQNFKSVNEINNFRTNQMNDIYNNSNKEIQTKHLVNERTKDNINVIHNAYNLIKKEQTYNKNFNEEVSKYLKIKNKI